MSTIAPTNARAQLADAVQYARDARHFDGCRCFMFRKDGAPYCSDREALWERAIDVLLDTIRDHG